MAREGWKERRGASPLPSLHTPITEVVSGMARRWIPQYLHGVKRGKIGETEFVITLLILGIVHWGIEDAHQRKENWGEREKLISF